VCTVHSNWYVQTFFVLKRDKGKYRDVWYIQPGFKVRKKWSPIICVKISFWQKRYGRLYVWSLERDL
jgi:hypothetical protein